MGKTAKYFIESPHTREECLPALDELLAKGPDVLERFDFGCAAGDHTSWALVESESESAARSLIPSFLRDKARVVPVTKFTPEQIRSYHAAG